jgi:hypothetical protein
MGHTDSVKAVYELRKAALEHGKAIAQNEADPRDARAEVLTTAAALEEKTIAALDECSENAEHAAEEAVREEHERAELN